MSKQVIVTRECRKCATEFQIPETELRRGRGRFCSLACSASTASINRDQCGGKNPAWKEDTDPRQRLRNKRYKDSNPEKIAAHRLLSSAIREGAVVRAPCQVCGSTNRIHGHHEDYSLPLDVQWLCSKHHVAAHATSLST